MIPHLDGLGGALVGVGSDQNYTMAAMARSEYLFMVDYDPLIPWVHRIYGVLVSASETPQELINRFSAPSERATRTLLREGLADDPQKDQIVRHWERRRSAWHAYLQRVSRLRRGGTSFSWLSNPEYYEYVRALHRNGRVIARNGDVTAEQTLRGVGQACERLGTKVRILYFSNAEQFFPYSASFIQNVRSLPMDDRSIVFRTIRHRSIEIADDGRWHYMIQELPDFLARLETGHYRRSFALTADLLSAGPPHLGRNGISTMTSETPRTVAQRAARSN